MNYDEGRFESIWKEVLTQIEGLMNDKNAFDSFFYGTKIESIEGDTITVSAPSLFSSQILNKRYLEDIQDILKDVTQSNYVCKIIYLNPNSDETPIQNISFASNLNPKFTFENFVVGQCNRESYVASLAAAMDPGSFYNPLFIYGRSGLGKTHLLHAIGNYIRLKNPSKNIFYQSTNDFIDDVIKAYKTNSIDQLKDKFKQVDVLLLDDIQFFSSKEKSKEIIFNIFNNMIAEGKQIVLTSDRHPSEIRSLEERLVGRFQSGLTVEISILEYETALAILKKKITAIDFNKGKIDEEVLEYIATNFSQDVRCLEGALNKLMFYTITINQSESIDMELAMHTFKQPGAKINKGLSIEKIKMVVGEYYNIPVSRLEGNRRNAEIVVPRQIAMYLCKQLLDVSLNKIGEEFGGKDHSTVINSISKVEKLLKENSDYYVAIDEIKNLLKNK